MIQTFGLLIDMLLLKLDNYSVKDAKNAVKQMKISRQKHKINPIYWEAMFGFLLVLDTNYVKLVAISY